MPEKPEALTWTQSPEKGGKSLEERIADIKDRIAAAPQEIDNELNKAGNSWIDCYLSRVTVISGLFETLLMRFPEAATDFKFADDNLKKLLVELYEAKEKYGKDVSETVKGELMSHLDIFKK